MKAQEDGDEDQMMEEVIHQADQQDEKTFYRQSDAPSGSTQEAKVDHKPKTAPPDFAGDSDLLNEANLSRFTKQWTSDRNVTKDANSESSLRPDDEDEKAASNQGAGMEDRERAAHQGAPVPLSPRPKSIPFPAPPSLPMDQASQEQSGDVAQDVPVDVEKESVKPDAGEAAAEAKEKEGKEETGCMAEKDSVVGKPGEEEPTADGIPAIKEEQSLGEQDDVKTTGVGSFETKRVSIEIPSLSYNPGTLPESDADVGGEQKTSDNNRRRMSQETDLSEAASAEGYYDDEAAFRPVGKRSAMRQSVGNFRKAAAERAAGDQLPQGHGGMARAMFDSFRNSFRSNRWHDGMIMIMIMMVPSSALCS